MGFNQVPPSLLQILACEFDGACEGPHLKKKSQQFKTQPNAPSLKSRPTFDLEEWMLQYIPGSSGPRPYGDGGRIWEPPDCVFRPGDGKTMFVVELPSGAISAGCQHATCPGSRSTGNHWRDLRILVGDAVTENSIATDWTGEKDLPSAIPITRPLIEHLICGPDLAKAEFPVRETLISPWLTTASLSMVYAPTGVGKSWFVMEEIRALTLGTPFLGWEVNRPCRALYIDGELPGAVIRERFNFLYGGPLPESLTILPSEYLMKEGAPLDLSSRPGQARINDLLEAMELRSLRPDLIVVDNLSSLTSADENDNTAQTRLLQWLMHLRHMQYAVQVVHHTGKSGDQRGASRRKDFMDAVVSLTPTGSEGAGFKVEFVKWRCKSKPKSATWALETGEHGEAIWSSSETALPQWKVALKLVSTKLPKDVTALGKLMDISRQAAQKHVEALRAKGLLKANALEPTQDGIRLINDLANSEEL